MKSDDSAGYGGPQMPLDRKTFKELFRLTSSKIRDELPSVDPAIPESLVRTSAASAAAAGTGLQDGIQDAVDQSFWQTQDGEFLDLSGEYDQTVRFDPQPATGQGAAPGTLGTIVPVSTAATAMGKTYLVTQESAVQEFSGGVTLSFSAGLVTAVTDIDHTLSTGLDVTISGATQTDYNGTFGVTVIDENTFTYEITAGSLTPDAGTYSSEYALLLLESQDSGSDTNLDQGGTMQISVIGLDGTVYVGNDGISGGLDTEGEEAYRTRVGEAHNLVPGISTPPQLVFSAKRVAGNTRVFIVRPETGVGGGTPGQPGYKPALGETVVYVLRDDDPSIIPSQAVLDETKEQMLSDGVWPTFLPDSTLYVIPPILVSQPFAFSSITPNTVTMQNAIAAQLPSFFEDNAEIEGTILLESINTFLRQVQDPATGDFLTAFTMTTPSADLVANSGEIYTSGTVTFS